MGKKSLMFQCCNRKKKKSENTMLKMGYFLKCKVLIIRTGKIECFYMEDFLMQNA